MPSIDERIVSMAFENQVFESRVATTMSTLTKLDATIRNIGGTSGFDKIETAANKVTLQQPMSALDKLKTRLSGAGSGAAEGLGEIDKAGNKVTLEGPSRAVDKLQGKMGQLNAGTTFTDIEKASDRVSLQGLTNALDNVTNKFSVLKGAASVALGGIATNAALKGAAFAKSFAFGPIQQGLSEYQTKLNATQTILANTQGQQVTGLTNVNKYLGQLNTYSDKTIYNFGEMAKNIGTFTAAGVDLPKSVESIKGIANLAALSGSNSEQASTAMYQLSQAIASGKVGLQDWNSVVNAGMGGAVFQKALMRTGENMGSISKGAVQIDKATGKATINGESFRESIMAKPGQQSWLTSDVLTKTLGQFTGDLTDAQLAAQGFNSEQIKTIQQTAKSAQNAATEVKTLPQVFDVARETIGSGWAQTFSLIFGDFEESKKTFTELSIFINGIINKMAAARNKVLGEWKKLGGRTVLIEGIKNAFNALMGVITPIKDAFRDIFPAKTGKDLYDFTVRFSELMAALKPSPETVDRLRRIFAGLFAAVDIGWTVIKKFVGVIFDLLGVVGKGSGGFLDFVAGIGDFLVKADEALVKGGGLKQLFKDLGGVISAPLALIKAVGIAIGKLFGIGDAKRGKGFEDSLQGVSDKLGPLKGFIDKVVAAWHKLVEIVNTVKTALDPWFSELATKLSGVGQILEDAFKGLNFDRIMEGLKVGFLGGIMVALKKALGGGVGGGILGTIKDTLGGVNSVLGGFTKQMEAMQSKLHAEALLAIAAAIALLAGSLYILSTIDGDKLASALTATAVGLGELMGAMKLMTSGLGKAGMLQLPLIAAGMIGLALAMTILAGAMKIFATMSWGDIVKGMAGVAGSIAAVGLSMELLPGGGPGLAIMSAGLILLGVSLNLIAASMKIFATMKWEDIAKGLAGVVGAIAGIGAAMKLMPPTLAITAAGLLILSAALIVIGGAVAIFGNMNLTTLAKGLVSMFIAISSIALAVSLIPPTIALSAVGLLLVGQAMVVVAAAIGLLGNMNIVTLAKGIVALAATLVVLAAGLTLMIVSIPGAAALLVAAAALAVLVPVLGVLGTMKWSTIFKGLAAIAAVMVTVGLASVVAAPGLLLLGLALVPLGLGLMLVAKAAQIFAKAAALMSSEGQKGFSVLLVAITAFIALLPNLVISFVKGLVSIVDQIVVLAPKVVTALGKILTTVIAFIIAQAPQLALAIGALITAVLTVVGNNGPKIQAAGFKLLQDLLTGLTQNIGSITTKGAEVIVKFLGSLTAKAPQLVAAGAKTMVAFITGIGSKIGGVVRAVANMVVKFVSALTRETPKVIGAGQDLIIKLIGAIAGFVPKLIRKGADIIISFLSGIQQAIPRIKNKAVSVARTFVNNLADGLVQLANVGFRGIIRFLNGLARAIRANDDAMINAGANVADAIRDGLVKGLHRAGPAIIRAAKDIALAIPKKFLKVLGITSPSKVMAGIGEFTILGFVKGIDATKELPTKAVGKIVAGMIKNLSKVSGGIAPSELTRKIGKEIATGFAKGIMGSATDIRTAFSNLRTTLTDQIKSLRDTITTDKKQLSEELAKRKQDQDPKLIADLQNTIRSSTADLSKMAAARNFLNNGLKNEKAQMIGLAKSYEKISSELSKAEETLKNLKTQRDEAAKGFTQKFSALPALDAGVTPEQFTKLLRDRVTAVQKYHATLQGLRAAGLDDTTYQMLLEQGTAGQQFADQLLAGGKPAIDQINALDTNLATAAKTLGDTAAHNLYDAGIKAAQGLIKGLKSQKSVIRQMMTDLADAMIKAIKKKLRIKSPSEIFAEVGNFVTRGLAQGLRDSSEAKVAATKLGEDVLTAMSGAISDNLDVDPVISPVLDLTNVEREAGKLDGMLPTTTIAATTSLDQASRISDREAALQAVAAQAVPATTVTLHQNNYSPEPLSNIELYRQTNNQLSRIKSLVGVK
ncbi:MAG: tape measure protein [Ktedonobacteraceae bacterium]